MSDGHFCFRHDSTELDHSENEDITIKRADGTDKVLKTHVRKRLSDFLSRF